VGLSPPQIQQFIHPHALMLQVSTVAEPNTLPAFFWAAGSEEGGAYSPVDGYSGGLGAARPFIPPDNCPVSVLNCSACACDVLRDVACLHTCLHVCMCASVRARVCVCVCVCVCVPARDPQPLTSNAPRVPCRTTFSRTVWTIFVCLSCRGATKTRGGASAR
jgi:hypothetical protein